MKLCNLVGDLLIIWWWIDEFLGHLDIIMPAILQVSPIISH